MCKHDRNWTIRESRDESGVFGMREGSLDREISFDAGEMHDMIEFNCGDCGMVKRVNRFSKRIPNYVSSAIERRDGNQAAPPQIPTEIAEGAVKARANQIEWQAAQPSVADVSGLFK